MINKLTNWIIIEYFISYEYLLYKFGILIIVWKLENA